MNLHILWSSHLKLTGKWVVWSRPSSYEVSSERTDEPFDSSWVVWRQLSSPWPSARWSFITRKRILMGSLISWRGPQNHNEIGDPGSSISWGPQNFMTPGQLAPLPARDKMERIYVSTKVIRRGSVELASLMKKERKKGENSIFTIVWFRL